MCQNITNSLNTPLTGTVPAGSKPVYAQYKISGTPANITFANAVEVTTVTSEIYATHMATPTMDSKNLITGPVSNPLPGDWNLLYYITSTTESNFTINTPAVNFCLNNYTAGDNCMYPLNPVTTSIPNPALVGTDISLNMGWWNYYTVSVTAPDPFWVSVYSANLKNFNLYVRKGAIPDESNYDFMDCNVYNQCGYANIINLNNTAAALPPMTVSTYYVGIKANANITYTIWWSSTCAPLCVSNQEESGVCTFTGGTLGQCTCEDGYMGFDCSLPNGTLPTQYIVLIIIASLVVLSALIGFFAWAYMQRKREGYSSLS
jgi:hypothetical protein